MGSYLLRILLPAAILWSCFKDKTLDEPVNGHGVPFEYQTDIQPDFASNCAISDCHLSPGDEDAFSLDGIDAIRTAINKGRPVVDKVDAGDMPPSEQLPQLRINQIKCWVAAGMAE